MSQLYPNQNKCEIEEHQKDFLLVGDYRRQGRYGSTFLSRYGPTISWKRHGPATGSLAH